MSHKRMFVFGELRSSPSFRWGLTLMIALVLMLEGFVEAEPRFFPLQDNSRWSEAAVRLMSSDPEGASLKVSVTGLLGDRMVTKGGEYVSLEIPGEGVVTQVGKPELPVIRRLVEIPLGATLSVELGPLSLEERSLMDLGLEGRIIPRQAPVPKIPGAAERATFIIDEEHYQTDTFWPPQLVTVREAGLSRQTRLALVEIFPVRYNPRRGVVRFCSSAEFRLTFQGADLARTRAHKERYSNLFASKGSSWLFIDTDFEPGPREGWYTPPVGYLIVAGDALYEAVLPLADWKRQQGFQVSLITTSQAGLDKAAIKGYIQDAYETWEIPPTFVLLVGDVDQLPTYSVGGITTDLYYSTINEGDYFPDIQVGRLSAIDSLELAGVVKKIIDYEKGLWDVDDGWTRRGYFMATNDHSYHELAEDTQDYSMRLARIHGMNCDSLYAYYGTGTPISQALNNGRSLAIYTGHGSFYGWAGPSFLQDDVQALENGQIYPLVCSHACLTGGYHKAVCFGETWLRAQNKGAAAFWGATVSSYWEEDDILQRRMFDALFDSSLTWLSGMMDKAKLEMWVYYGGGGLSENYYKMYNLLGDPSMHLWTRPPKTLVASHSSELPLGASSFMLNVLQPRASGPDSQNVLESTVFVPVNNARASLIRENELYGTALTIDGKVWIKLDPLPLAEGPMDIGVSKPGYRPYLGFAEVVADGPYLLYQSHLLDDLEGGNGDGQASPGENFQLQVTIKNVGNEEAHQVIAILAEEDAYVQTEHSSASFGHIPPGDSSLGFPSYECSISDFCPSGHQIAFTLTAVDNLNRQWSSGFEIPVVSPELRCQEHQISDDPPGGNGNGVAEDGEALELVVILRNYGLAKATGVTATLHSTDPHIQVLSNNSAFGDLAPGSQASGSPAYEIAVSGVGSSLLFCPLVLDIAAESGYAVSDTLALVVGAPGFSDDMESGTGLWTHEAIGEEFIDHWHLSAEKSYSGSHSWKCGDSGGGTYSHNENGALVSPAILLVDNSVLTFWHWLEAEVYDETQAWDGGIVEVSSDGGASWEQIEPVDGYPFTIYDAAPSVGSPFAAGTPCFSGYHDWQREQFDLSAYSGLISLRFRFGSDNWTEREGWYLDDVQVAAPRSSPRHLSDLQILSSDQQILLQWDPSVKGRGPVRYEIYRSHEPTEVVQAEHRLAVVSEPRFVDHLKVLDKSHGSLFYAVVGIDADGRRIFTSEVVGLWSYYMGSRLR